MTVKSNFLRKKSLELGARADRIAELNWGIDLSFASGMKEVIRARHGLPHSAKVVLIPRALQPLYNTHLAVDAFRLLVETVPDAYLIITCFEAEESYKKFIQARVAESGISARVLFVPAIPRSEMVSYMEASDIALHLPSSDGLPQSLIEAMAAGAVNVVNNLSCYDDIIEDGVTGSVVSLDAKVIADKLSYLMLNDGIRAQIGASARKLVTKRFDKRREDRRLQQIYLRLAAVTGERVPLGFRLEAIIVVAVNIVGRYGVIDGARSWLLKLSRVLNK